MTMNLLYASYFTDLDHWWWWQHQSACFIWRAECVPSICVVVFDDLHLKVSIHVVNLKLGVASVLVKTDSLLHVVCHQTTAEPYLFWAIEAGQICSRLDVEGPLVRTRSGIKQNLHYNVETDHESQRADVLMTRMHELWECKERDEAACPGQHANPDSDSMKKTLLSQEYHISLSSLTNYAVTRARFGRARKHWFKMAAIHF